LPPCGLHGSTRCSGAIAKPIKAVRRELRANCGELSADAGCCDDANLTFLARQRTFAIDGYRTVIGADQACGVVITLVPASSALV
jgi:hypothetical protein